MIVELYAKSDVGRVRRGNEDNFLVLDLSTAQTWTGVDGAPAPENLTHFDLGDKGLVLVVSDGMGGALAGDVASRMAVDSVRQMLVGESEEDCDPNLDLVECLKNATHYANTAIHLRSQEDSRCAGMGATFTGAAIRGDSLDLVQVGDSRGYVIRTDQRAINRRRRRNVRGAGFSSHHDKTNLPASGRQHCRRQLSFPR